MTDLGWVFAGLAVLACGAWIFAEARIVRLEARHDELKRRYVHLSKENRAIRLMLGEAITALPDTPQGRQVGDAIRFQVWSDRKQRRLERHLSLVDPPTFTGGAA